VCAAVEGGSSSGSKPKSKEVMELSRSNFLSMLKGDTAPAATGKAGGGAVSSALPGGKGLRKDENSDSEGEGKGGAAWGAVRDSYLTDRKLALKVMRCPYACSMSHHTTPSRSEYIVRVLCDRCVGCMCVLEMNSARYSALFSGC
jgi:hypothetical protein